MKKTVLILMLALLPLTAQARSVKLGENSDVFTGTKSVRKKVCTENKQCITGLRANVRLRSGLRLRWRSVHYVRVGGQRVQLRGRGSERLRGMPVRGGKLSVRRQVRQVLRLHDMRVGLDQSRKGRPLLLQVNTRRPFSAFAATSCKRITTALKGFAMTNMGRYGYQYLHGNFYQLKAP